MATIIWENGRPKLIYGNTDKGDDWIKNVNKKAAQEEIEIHEELADNAKDEDTD